MQNRIHKNGRPSKSEQIQIQRELLPYFEQGISPGLTAEKTGINIKTVYDYFDELVEKVSKSEESDFLQRQRNERIRIIISFDKQILEANRHFDDINDEKIDVKKGAILYLDKPSSFKETKCFDFDLMGLEEIAKIVRNKLAEIRSDIEPYRVITFRCDYCPHLKTCDPHQNGGSKKI